MTKNEFIGVLRECGCGYESAEFMFKFAHFVAEKEREACAKLCDPVPGIKHSPNARSARKRCADAIRARGGS